MNTVVFSFIFIGRISPNHDITFMKIQLVTANTAIIPSITSVKSLSQKQKELPC